jgi:two-component system sensor histidine kinase ChiS
VGIKVELTLKESKAGMFSSQKTVVVVDDEQETAEMIAEMVRLSGYQVVLSSGGDPAIHRIAKEKPDLVILDVMMPGMSGLDMLRFMRRDPRLVHIPVVLVSARDRIEDIQAGMAAGASLYLTKPVSFNDFKSAVNLVLAPA